MYLILVQGNDYNSKFLRLQIDVYQRVKIELCVYVQKHKAMFLNTETQTINLKDLKYDTMPNL